MNFQQQTDQMLTELPSDATLLLHSCCGPCSSYVLSYLSRYFSRITVLFYNPCIHPEREFEHRLAVQKQLIDQMPMGCPVDLLVPPYEPQTFFDMVKGYEDCPEGGDRCQKCYEQRLQKTAELADEMQYTYFATTLTVSPHKNAVVINRVGQRAQESKRTLYLPSDFKKKEGYKQSLQLSKTYDLYRQDYCGCVYSMRGESR